jgi:uncharacterized protein YdeI (YjbR/CyaY-like superfamily)
MNAVNRHKLKIQNSKIREFGHWDLFGIWGLSLPPPPACPKIRLMEATEPLYFASGDEWRQWLEHNHKTAGEAWLVYYKKGVKKPGISYREALDEALNFGWIDTRLKSLDKESYMLRYAPRKPGSAWSKANRERAEELMREGRMAPAGLAAIEEARRSGQWDKS